MAHLLGDVRKLNAFGWVSVVGSWLINTILADYGRVAKDVPAQAAVLLARLQAGGPAVVDDLRNTADRRLDVDKPQERARAVRTTIEASTSLLNPSDAERFAELGVFAEDEVIPFHLAARLWHATAGLDNQDDLQASQICERLAQLALVSRATGPDHGITVHDVVRDLLRAELGPQRLADLNGKLLDDAAKALSTASPVHPALPAVGVAWWELSQEDRYLWDHLLEHLRDAGRSGDAEAIACDLRWVGARLEWFGPAAPVADLSAVGTPQAIRMRAALVRAAHLLTPAEPAGTVVDILHSRVAGDPAWGPQVRALQDICRRPRLVNRWPLPDLAGPALLSVLTGHDDSVLAVAVAPDGSWLASASGDRTVRIWDVATGRQRAALEGHTKPVLAVAVAPDGSWLASGGSDKRVRIWNVATRQELAVLTGWVGRRVRAVAIAPDGSWLGFSGNHVQIWDVATSRGRRAMIGHTGPVVAVAVAPDGSWLASGGTVDRTVVIWDVATSRERAVLKGHTKPVEAVAVAPNGRWLASASRDGTVRIWDVATGQERAVLEGHTGPVVAVAVAPDGSWLASGGEVDKTVVIWDVATGRKRAVLEGHTDWVCAVAVAPDGSWLASASGDRTVRIWDVATGWERVALEGRTDWVRAVAAAPDGSWLASAGSDDTVRIWDVATGRQRAALAGHTDWVHAAAAAPDGSWLASASAHDRTVRIWDVATGRERAVLKGIVGVVAIAPDGSWLASGGWDRRVRIWDVATGRKLSVLKGHRDRVRAVAVAPDGSWLASASEDHTVRIWDVATGRERAVLEGHTGWVEAVAVAPDGSWLASASKDGTVRIWDMAAGQTRAAMRVEHSLTTCAWLGVNALAVGGSAGLYLFSFLANTSPAAEGY